MRGGVMAALAMRHTLLMTLMPDSGYAGVTQALVVDLAAVPWKRPYRLSAATVICAAGSGRAGAAGTASGRGCLHATVTRAGVTLAVRVIEYLVSVAGPTRPNCSA